MMLSLYPDIKPYVRHTLAAASPHQLYVEECGNPSGLPVLYLHADPGAGCRPQHRCFFDPDIYRIILFDQRGCGRSLPHGALEENTSRALITDIEHIRTHLGIERWLLFGSSWGSTLGLLYGETYPERVLGLILQGIFLGRAQDLRWRFQTGAPQIFPDAWVQLVEEIPSPERNDLIGAFYRRLNGFDELARMAAAKALNAWQARCSSLTTDDTLPHEEHATLLARTRIQLHYAKHRYFIEPNQLLHDASRLENIPGIIIHGRYDMVYPLSNAWELHEAWPRAELQIMPAAGHAATEPAILDALVRATNLMASRIG